MQKVYLREIVPNCVCKRFQFIWFSFIKPADLVMGLEDLIYMYLQNLGWLEVRVDVWAGGSPSPLIRRFILDILFSFTT